VSGAGGEQRKTRLAIIRHGEAQCAVDEIVGGHRGCTGLSKEGVGQAEALRDRLARTGELAGADVLLTSVLARAVQTAEIIAPAVGGGDLVAARHCELCEMHPGEADGLTWAEFGDRYGYVDADADPFREVSPGGESQATFLLRVAHALRDVTTEHAGRHVVVVAHGGVIDGSFHAFMNLPLRRGFHLATANTSITEWELDAPDSAGGEGVRPGRWRLLRYNDAAHLQ
jgi:probable phosphoglycerate mutase